LQVVPHFARLSAFATWRETDPFESAASRKDDLGHTSLAENVALLQKSSV